MSDVIQRLSAEGVDPLALAGVNDGNLLELSKRLGVRVSLRGDSLSLAGTAETVQRGIGLLIAYSAGLGVPFLLSALALGSFLRFFKRYRPFIATVERAAGVLLVAVGILVATNYYVVLNSWAISLTPEWLLKRL